mmetsp:Transcript_39980/g.93574  ORF Transcript_39980/g.93574 Transcript_39980/m.93574 type:complete len:516 (+) Transcript_39980:104-1651(+)
MPPKKPAGTKMSMAELNSKFGGSVVDQMLPSQSVGKDFGKSKGKGLRDIDGGKEEEWRSSGPRKGKGKGDSEPSRADTGDWRGGARDGPGDRGGFGDRGDRFGDRDRGGKGRGDGEPSRADAGDWRSGGGRQDGPRDRDRDGGGGGFRRENRDDHTQAGKDDDWRGNSGRRGGPERSSAPSAPVQMPGQGKYVPPALRKQMEEQAKMDGERKRDDDDRLARQRDNDRRMEEDKERRREELRSKQKEQEEKRRAEDDRRQREEDAKMEKKRAEENKKAEAEKQRKMELKAAKEAEAREKREAIKSASQAQKKAATGSSKKQDHDPAKVAGFMDTCEGVLKDDGSVEKLVEEVEDLLTENELCTVHPMAQLVDLLLRESRGKEDDDVFTIVQNWAPVLNCLIEKSGVRRFKVKVLIECQRAAHKMGLPRLSPATALLEAFFDGLYRAEVIEEDYFDMWAMGDDDTPGKTSAMFQVNVFLDWLRGTLREDKEEDMEEGEGEEEESGEEDEEEDEDAWG